MPPSSAIATRPAPPATGRPRRRRLPVWPLVCGLASLLGAVVVIGPSALSWQDGFIAWSNDVPGGPLPPGDHLQMSYYLWLWEHALTSLDHLPWVDPFQFTAGGGDATLQPFGWPLALVSVPISLVAGPVAAYNALVVLAFVAAALAAGWLARTLGSSPAAAVVAGFAFAFAPFRLVQATSHVNALLAFLIPLTLALIERALRGDRPGRAAWWATACHLSLLAAGELHLAVFQVMVVAGFVAVRLPGVPRSRLRRLAPAAASLVAGSAAIALVQHQLLLLPSVAGGGRTAEEAAHFGPRLGDLWSRDVDWATFERYAYPGAAILVLALVGAAVALRSPRHRLLGGAALVAAAGVTTYSLLPGLTGHPWLQELYRAVPLLSFSRVPGRILIISALCLAVLAALAVDAVPTPRLRAAVAALASVVILLDAPAGLFATNAADATAVDDVAAGTTVVHLPPFDAGHFSGSPYTFLLTRSPGPRVNGYSPFVTPDAAARLEEVAALVEVPLPRCAWARAVDALGIEQVAVHRSLFGPDPLQWDADGDALVEALERDPAFSRVAGAGEVVRFTVARNLLGCG